MSPTIHIEGRRWFQRSYGNTYHKVRLWVDGQCTHSIMRYGYGDHYLQTAWDMLQAQGIIPADQRYGGTLALRETYGATYSVIDVQRKADL